MTTGSRPYLLIDPETLRMIVEHAIARGMSSAIQMIGSGGGGKSRMVKRLSDIEERLRFIEKHAVGCSLADPNNAESDTYVYIIKVECPECGTVSTFEELDCGNCGESLPTPVFDNLGQSMKDVIRAELEWLEILLPPDR